MKQIAGNTECGGKSFDTKFTESKQKNKCEYNDDEDNNDDDDNDDDAIPTQTTPQRLPWNKQINKKKRSNVMFDSSIIHSTSIESQQQQQQQQQQVTPFNLRDEEIFKTDDDPSSLETSVRQVLFTPQYTSRSSEIAKSIRTVRTNIRKYSFNW